ncbi:MAG: TerB family tellurite resistance protein, partial [Xanthomonadales bacterium]|nr:TerB family tellurite resistance protein [Xanthomonadales bacterium]
RDWVEILDSALPKLDRLRPAEKEKLVAALVEVVQHDGSLAASELELLRVICDLVHVPLPLLTAPQQTSLQS